MATTSRATAQWEGKLKDGKGSFKAASGAFSGPYTFATRFEGAKGTSPEELIAAAHAACFSMALSAGLERAGTPATRVETSAAATLDMVGGAQAGVVRAALTQIIPPTNAAAGRISTPAASELWSDTTPTRNGLGTSPRT